MKKKLFKRSEIYVEHFISKINFERYTTNQEVFFETSELEIDLRENLKLDIIEIYDAPFKRAITNIIQEGYIPAYIIAPKMEGPFIKISASMVLLNFDTFKTYWTEIKNEDYLKYLQEIEYEITKNAGEPVDR